MCALVAWFKLGLTTIPYTKGVYTYLALLVQNKLPGHEVHKIALHNCGFPYRHH